jgi:ABC-type siderophore export system fused ATPase/permease subunit
MARRCVASHDERVIEVADRTVRLDEGRVVT